MSPLIENGLLLFRSRYSPLVRQLLGYPYGNHDDLNDALYYAFAATQSANYTSPVIVKAPIQKTTFSPTHTNDEQKTAKLLLQDTDFADNYNVLRFQFCLLLYFLCIFSLYSQAVISREYGFSIEPPVEWEASTNKNKDQFMFISPDEKIQFQLLVSSADPNISVRDLFNRFVERMGKNLKDLDDEDFLYNGYSSLLGQFSLEKKETSIHNFVLLIQTKQYIYWMQTTVHTKVITQEDLALVYSALDSFAMGNEGKKMPGPITQFDTPLQVKRQMKQVEINFAGQTIHLDMDEEQAESAQRLVEREALIMSRYHQRNELAYLAWIRYYRFIYRDNFSRLKILVDKLQPYLKGKSVVQIAQELLSFCQHYSYERFTTPSDLIAPYASILSRKGDCDSSALTYIILLNYQDIPAALLLSQTLGHAVAGASVEMEGSATEIFGQRYIIAELTTKQPLGTVPVKVAQTNDWFPLLFKAQ